MAGGSIGLYETPHAVLERVARKCMCASITHDQAEVDTPRL